LTCINPWAQYPDASGFRCNRKEKEDEKLDKEVEMPVLAKDYDDFTYERSEKVPPRASGVYQLADRNYQVVKIGSSAILQEKLLEHLRDTGPLKAKVRYFWVEEAANFKEKEQELLEEYKKAHNGALPEENR